MYADRKAKLAATEADNTRKQSEANKTITGQRDDLARKGAALSESLKASNRRLASFYFEKAKADFEKGKNGAGLVRLAACWRAAVNAEDRDWKHVALGSIAGWARYTPSPRMIIAPAENVVQAAFSPDGRSVLVGCKDNQAGGFGGLTARLWDTATDQPLGPLMNFHPHKVNSVVFSPDARTVATLGETPDSGIKVTPSGGTVVSHEYEIRVWNAATGQPIGEPLRPGGSVHDVVFSPDGQTLLIVDAWRPLLWNLSTGKSRTLEGVPERLAHRRSSNDTSLGRTRMLEGVPKQPEQISDLVTLSRAGCFSPDGRNVLIGASRGRAIIWDTVTAEPLLPVLSHDVKQTRQGANGEVNVVEYSPDGRTILTAIPQGTVRLWDAATGRPIGEPLRPEGEALDPWGYMRRLHVAFSPDGQTLLTGWPIRTPVRHNLVFPDCMASLWNAASGRPFGDPLRHQGSAVAFSPNGRIFATANEDGEMRLWDAASGRPIGLPLPIGPENTVVQFSPDGRTLVTGGIRGAMLWELASCQPNGPQFYNQSGVLCATFTPDGRTVLTGGFDSSARLWDAATGQRLGPVLKLPSAGYTGVWVVAFSPDGRIVSFGGPVEGRSVDGSPPIGWWDTPASIPTMLISQDRRVGLWNVGTGRPLELSAELRQALQGRSEEAQTRAAALPRPPALTPDAQADRNDRERWLESQRSRPQNGKKRRGLISWAFRPGGLTLLIATDDGRARLWDAASGRPLGPPMEQIVPEQVVPIETRGLAPDPPSPSAKPTTEMAQQSKLSVAWMGGLLRPCATTARPSCGTRPPVEPSACR